LLMECAVRDLVLKSIMLLWLLPVGAFANPTDCHITETADRIEVVCVGDPAGKKESLPVPPPVKPVQGKHRLDPRHMDQERLTRLQQMNRLQPQSATATAADQTRQP